MGLLMLLLPPKKDQLGLKMLLRLPLLLLNLAKLGLGRMRPSKALKQKQQ